MKKFLFIALFVMGISTASAQFRVYDNDGNVVFEMESSRPAYIEFETPEKIDTVKYNGTIGDYVDLGLPSGTLWADHNIGASRPEECGDYYAWAEIETKDLYDWSTYFDSNEKGSVFYKYKSSSGIKNIDILEEDDVAFRTWGSEWIMPTYSHMVELTKQCYWELTESYRESGVIGYIVYKAKRDEDRGVFAKRGETPLDGYNVDEDVHIFIPFTGRNRGSEVKNVGVEGFYWSSTLNSGFSLDAKSLLIGPNGGASWLIDDRYYGQTVRPIRKGQ